MELAGLEPATSLGAIHRQAEMMRRSQRRSGLRPSSPPTATHVGPRARRRLAGERRTGRQVVAGVDVGVRDSVEHNLGDDLPASCRLMPDVKQIVSVAPWVISSV
jgi:hypothetical protein